MSRRTRTITFSVVALTSLALIVPASAGDQGGASQAPAPQTKTDAVKTETVSPSFTGQVRKGDATFGTAHVSDPRKQKTTERNVVKLAPGEAATPQQIVPEGVDPTAVRAAAEDLKLTTCLYAPIVTPTPEPPFDDREKFGVSKQGPGLRGWSLAHDSQGGTDSEPRTTSTRIDYDVPIVIPDDWAQPSQITGYANPKVKGAIRAASRRFTAGTSTANGQQYLNIGMERDGDEYWQSMYDMKFSRENGLDETKGFESGPRDDPFFANIDTTPGHLYKFRVKSQSHVTSNPEFLAPAAAQLDFGAGIDAPAHLIEDGYIEPDGGWKTFIVQYKSPFDVEC